MLACVSLAAFGGQIELVRWPAIARRAKTSPPRDCGARGGLAEIGFGGKE